MQRLLALCRRIDRLLLFIGSASGVLFILLIFTIVFDVLTRGQGWTNSTKLQELEWHFHAALCFLVFAYTMTLDKHVRVEVFRERWRPRTKAAVELVLLVLLFLPLCFVALYYSVGFVGNSYEVGESSPSATGLSHRWFIKSFQPLAFILLLLAGLSSFLKNLAVLLTGTTAEDPARTDDHLPPLGI